MSEREQKRREYMQVPDRRITTNTNKHASASGLLEQLHSYYIPEDMKADDQARKGDGLYTDKSLFLRESLKFSPKIIAVLDDIWELTDRFPKDGQIQKAEYLIMSKKLNRVFCADDDDYTANTKAEEEWARDSFGRDTLDKTTFTQAWFQLADIWTDDIDVDEYYHFLQIVLRAFSVLNREGRRNFRDDRDVLPFSDSEDQYFNQLDAQADEDQNMVSATTTVIRESLPSKESIAPLPDSMVVHIQATAEVHLDIKPQTDIEVDQQDVGPLQGMGHLKEKEEMVEYLSSDDSDYSDEYEDECEDNDEEEDSDEDGVEMEVEKEGNAEGSRGEGREEGGSKERPRRRRRRRRRNHSNPEEADTGQAIQSIKTSRKKWKVKKKYSSNDFSSISAIITLRKIYVKLCKRDIGEATQLLCDASLGKKNIEESGTLQATYIRDALAYIRRRLNRKYQIKIEELSESDILTEVQTILQQFVSAGDGSGNAKSKKVKKQFVDAFKKHQWRKRWQVAPKKGASRSVEDETGMGVPPTAEEAPQIVVEAISTRKDGIPIPAEEGTAGMPSFQASPSKSKKNPGPGGFRLRKAVNMALPAINVAKQERKSAEAAQEQRMRNLSRYLIHESSGATERTQRFQKAVRQVRNERTPLSSSSRSLPALAVAGPNSIPRYMQSTRAHRNQLTSVSSGNFQHKAQESKATTRRALETVATFARFNSNETITTAKAKAQLVETGLSQMRGDGVLLTVEGADNDQGVCYPFTPAKGAAARSPAARAFLPSHLKFRGAVKKSSAIALMGRSSPLRASGPISPLRASGPTAQTSSFHFSL
jgi:hypothetical protein